MAYLSNVPSRTPGNKNNGNQGMQMPPAVQGADGSGPDVAANINQLQEWTSLGNGSVPFGKGNSAQAGSTAFNLGATAGLATGIVGAAHGGVLSGVQGTTGGGLGATARHATRGGASSQLYGIGGGRTGRSGCKRAGAISAHHRVADFLHQAYPLGQDGYEALPPNLQPESMASQQLQQQALNSDMGVLQHQLNELNLNSASAPAVAAPVLASAHSPRHGRAEQELDISNVYVSHLPYAMTGDDFLAFMSKFGTVVSCRMLHGQTWQSRGVKGVGFARMANAEQAANAIQAVNGMELPGHNSRLRAKVAYKTNRDIPHETPTAGTNGQEQTSWGQADLPSPRLVFGPFQGGTMRPAAPANRPRMAAAAGVGPGAGPGYNLGFHANQLNPLLGNNFPMDINALAGYFHNVALPNLAGGSGGAWAQHGFGGILAPLPAGPNNCPGYGVNAAAPNFGGINQYMNGAQGPGGGCRHGQQNLQNAGF